MDAASVVASIRQLAKFIDAPSSLIPATVPSDQGAPHIEANNSAYHFVVCERGQELERRTTSEMDELLYWTFQSITFSMAADWELAHRQRGQDARRQLFKRQHELLGKLNAAWAARRDAEVAEVLREHPFDEAF